MMAISPPNSDEQGGAIDLARVDLNLLVSLDRLLEHASVTRAAAAVGVSQPAMTQALARIRELFGDPILVRARHGMTPTPFAERLRPRLTAVIRELGELLRPQTFDPATTRLTVRIEMDDASQLLLLPPLLAQLRARAPGMLILARSPSPEPPQGLLESQQLHLSIGGDRNFVGEFHRRQLGVDALAYVVRADDPHGATAAGDPLARYLALDHVSVTPSASVSRVAEEAIARAGGARRVIAWVPSFLVASALAEHAGAALTLPAKLAARLAADGRFVARPFPVETEPLATVAVWHGSTDRDLAQRWLRDLIAEVAGAPGSRDRVALAAATRAVLR